MYFFDNVINDIYNIINIKRKLYTDIVIYNVHTISNTILKYRMLLYKN